MDCPTSQQAKVKDYTVCIEEELMSTSSLNNLVPILTSGLAGALAVALIVLFMIWKKRRNNKGTTTTRTGTNYTASNDNSNAVTKANAALWNDPDLLAVMVNADNIQDVKKIGSGAFCDVWLVLYRGTQRVASKCLRDVTRSRAQAFIDEIKLVATLSYPTSSPCTQEADLQALFEFMDGGDLRDYLQDPLVPREWTAQKLQIATDIVEALVYVHSFVPPLVYRDLKSRNVLLGSSDDSGNDGLLVAKLTDFGVSRFRSDDNTMTTGVGTGKWLALEIITGDGTYGAPADIFSLGAVLSELDTHKLPYEDMRGANGNPLSQVAMLKLVASGELRPSFLPSCPPPIAELAQRCLALRPADRPSAPELAYALRQIKKNMDGVS